MSSLNQPLPIPAEGPSEPAVRARTGVETLLVPLFAVLIVGAWELACRGFGVSDLILPAPSQVLVALYQGFRSGQFLTGLWATSTAVVLGFLVSATGAFLLGTLISQIRLVEVMVFPYVVAIQTLPKIAIAPLIMIWVGVGLESKIIIAAMVSFFPMLVNTIVGLKSTPEEKIDLMRSLSASRWKLFRYVQLPEALPFIFAGLNIGIVLSVLGAIVGEFISAKAGLGYLILQMNYNMDIAGMFAALVVLGIMGIVLNSAMQYARRKIIFWQPDKITVG
ncbi:MAG: ABC transporter permease [Hyphomicrobiales bacterium]|nr:ABC transporter permease [Hyphomicrobiales bacterium]